MTTEQATLGGGCYWCLDALYRRIRGVTKVESGYSGGHSDNPTTAQVYEGHTGHAEVVQLSFDPTVITYRELLEIFFVMHDPTTLNRQGYDVGDEYRSIILFQSNEQQSIAEDMIQTFATTVWNAPIVTQLVPFAVFWPADEDMQSFYEKRPGAGYCQAIIDPKIQKLRKEFSQRFIEA
jgi:peptide-methionine (S)-S-oxide reductase